MAGKKETNDSDLFRAVMQDVKPLKSGARPICGISGVR